MTQKIYVAILDDHQGIVDGYVFRLNNIADIQVVATMTYGEELEKTLTRYPVDVLILDVYVPISPENPNPYPILHVIPKLLEKYSNLSVLPISMHAQRALISAIMEAGASGYILKDDQASIRELESVIRTVAGGGIHMSHYAYQQMMRKPTSQLHEPLTLRQREVLSLCAAYPDASTEQLAAAMNIANSTLRNLLSGAYLKINVRTRAAAIAKARQMGLITPDIPKIDLLQVSSKNKE